MVRGEKIKKRGYEVCLFPLDYLYCTQTSSPTEYSHCCGHPCDWIGSHSIYPIYAPFTCTKQSFTDNANGRIFVSDDKVWTPSGLTYVSIYTCHDETPLSQTHFEQGDIIGHTGMYEAPMGDHVHLDQTLQQATTTVYSGRTCEYGNQCYMLPNSAYAYDVFYLSGSETIITTRGMEFQTWTGGSGNFRLWMYKKYIERKRGIA